MPAVRIDVAHVEGLLWVYLAGAAPAVDLTAATTLLLDLLPDDAGVLAVLGVLVLGGHDAPVAAT